MPDKWTKRVYSIDEEASASKIIIIASKRFIPLWLDLEGSKLNSTTQQKHLGILNFLEKFILQYQISC